MGTCDQRSSGVIWAGRAALLALAALGGCQNFTSGSTTAQAAGAAAAVSTAPRVGGAIVADVPPTGTRLKAGVTPLNYMVGPGGALTVWDVTDAKAVVRAAAPAQAVVRVDDETGVSVANVVVKAGPLAKGHRYEIWVK